MAETVEAERVAEFEDAPDELQDKVQQLSALLRNSAYTVLFTGAGISTSAGISDYRGPSGCWTIRRLRALQEKEASGRLSEDEAVEMHRIREAQQAEASKVPDRPGGGHKEFLEPGYSHMAIATMVRRGLAQYVITTNLDGLLRKAGLVPHAELCCLHGDVFVERCTGCGAEFERNFRVRRPGRHVHDHHAGCCQRCGSAAPEAWTGLPRGEALCRTIAVESRPAEAQVSLERILANARRRWPSAELTGVNGARAASDDELRRVVRDAELPLSFEFRVSAADCKAAVHEKAKTGACTSFAENHLVGVKDVAVGTKDTHINFGESLDDADWDEADAHSRRADLCLVLGTSMSLKHVVHFPFMAKKTVIVNLQCTPYDDRSFGGLRLWSSCDDTLRLLLQASGITSVLPAPAWRPRDPLPVAEIQRLRLGAKCEALAKHLEKAARAKEQPGEDGEE